MTAQEYNHDFLPRINRAEEFVELFESSIEHMSETRVDKDEVGSSNLPSSSNINRLNRLI